MTSSEISVVIKDTEYSVQFVREISGTYLNTQSSDSGRIHGQIDFDAKTIEVGMWCPDKRATFMHELIHGILWENNFKAETHNEKLVECLAQSLIKTLTELTSPELKILTCMEY